MSSAGDLAARLAIVALFAAGLFSPVWAPGLILYFVVR
jgi:hypothetical protein